jgi:hypothetical protein
MEKDNKTFMWQELHGEPEFRFQTMDPKLHKRMHRNSYFKLVLIGMSYILPIDTTTIYFQQYKDIVGIYGQK